jgi:glycosyltransferase involved in cell wall biosynthesis
MGAADVNNDKHGRAYTVALICDFHIGLTRRILDVYKIFQEPPHIVLVKKGERISFDPGSRLELVRVPIPVTPVEAFSRAKVPLVFCSLVAYLAYSVLAFLKARSSPYPVRLVHAHYIFPQGLFGLILCKLLNVPLLVTAAGQDVNVMLKSNSILRAACLFVLRRSRIVIAVNPSLLQILQQDGITRSMYIPNSVDASNITPVDLTAREDSILFVASMTERKRPMVLLKAYEKVVAQLPTATLVMCGEGPEESKVRREVMERGLEGKVTLTSRLSERELNSLRASTSMFVLPSASEGTSLALLESMAAGQAVIVSRIPSHSAILEHERNALLFTLDDEEALANQILRLTSDKRLKEKISRGAMFLSSRRFSNVTAARQLEEIYREAIDR